MSFLFIFQMLVFSYFAYSSELGLSLFLYLICLWICGYYFWRYHIENRKSYKLAWLYLSNIMFSFIMICKLMDIYINNLR